MSLPFDLTSTYVFLEDGGRAPTIEVTETFWRDLMGGNPSSSDAALVAQGEGWLTAIYRMERDTTTWEMHPAGDELLVLLSGAIDIVLDEDGGQRVVELREGARLHRSARHVAQADRSHARPGARDYLRQ